MSQLKSLTNDVEDPWQTSPDYTQEDLEFPASKFLEITNLLLANPNLNSTHLFRADILFDSTGVLKTPAQKERDLVTGSSGPEESGESEGQQDGEESPQSSTTSIRSDGAYDAEHVVPGAVWPDFELQRTVIRRLVPRKPQLDRSLEQLCRIYSKENLDNNAEGSRWLVVYHPRVTKEESMPWYHPPVKALAYLYEISPASAKLSVHFLPFTSTSEPIPERLHRTLLSLLHTFTRLAKHQPHKTLTTQSSDQTPNPAPAERSLALSALKDTIIPQHVVQDTYTRLKQTYAADLIIRWVEKTEPSKHVFEDLAIAAFLIELWRQRYGAEPAHFPGFVDIACGNGVLVYVLRKEGYSGYGFDARRRRTWDVWGMDGNLREQICVPLPFLDALSMDADDGVHNGIFPAGTFIISNHADELTPWTPLLAALSSPQSPLPFLAIPCCSHALSGARHRYSAKEVRSTTSPRGDQTSEIEEQSANGDLKALRAAKNAAASHGDDKSMYACLTRKVVALAEELGFEVKLTLMRIPSTRNIGVVGNWRPAGVEGGVQEESGMRSTIEALLERECALSGGLQSAANMWIEGARKLQVSKGRGKVNLGKAGYV